MCTTLQEFSDKLDRLEAAKAKGTLLGPVKKGPQPIDNRAQMPSSSIGSIGSLMLDDAKKSKPQMAAKSTTRKVTPPPPPAAAAADDDDDEPPPLV